MPVVLVWRSNIRISPQLVVLRHLRAREDAALHQVRAEVGGAERALQPADLVQPLFEHRVVDGAAGEEPVELALSLDDALAERDRLVEHRLAYFFGAAFLRV